jgi:putative transposase
VWRAAIRVLKAPQANAICERVVGTLHRELLDRIMILGPGQLRRALAEYATHDISRSVRSGEPCRAVGEGAPVSVEWVDAGNLIPRLPLPPYLWLADSEC